MEKTKRHFSFGIRLLLALALLLTMAFVFSCEDNPTEPTGNIPSFMTWAEYQSYMAGKEWGIRMDKLLEDASNLYLGFDFAAYAPNDVTSDDTFILTVEDVNRPLTVNAGVVTMVAQYVTVPLSTTEVDVVFKRNGTTQFDKTVKIAPNPSNLSSSQNPDLTAAIPVSWTLSRTCSVQLLEIEVYGSTREEYDSFDVVLNPTARSYTIPANSVSVATPIDGTIYVDEALITESNDSVVISSSSAMRDLYGTSKNIKKAHRNRF